MTVMQGPAASLRCSHFIRRVTGRQSKLTCMNNSTGQFTLDCALQINSYGNDLTSGTLAIRLEKPNRNFILRTTVDRPLTPTWYWVLACYPQLNRCSPTCMLWQSTMKGESKSTITFIAGLGDRPRSWPGWSKNSTNLQQYKHTIHKHGCVHRYKPCRCRHT